MRICVSLPGVPASGVGGETTKLLGAAASLEGLGELLRTWLQVGVPTEPASVTSVEVHDDVGEVEVLDGVSDTVTVTRGGVLARLLVGIGDKVGERIGLDDEREGNVGVL